MNRRESPDLIEPGTLVSIKVLIDEDSIVTITRLYREKIGIFLGVDAHGNSSILVGNELKRAYAISKIIAPPPLPQRKNI